MAVSTTIYVPFDVCIYLVTYMGWNYDQETIMEIMITTIL